MEILIVDDNLDFAEGLKEMLELEAYSVIIAQSGAEALTKYRQYKYHLVLMDLKMPGMSGLQTMEEIRKVDPGARILVITGNTLSDDIEKLKDMDIVGLLRKPVNPTELFHLVGHESSRFQEE